MWISILFIFLGTVFGLEVGKVEVRERDVLIHLKGAKRVTLVVVDPPKVKGAGPNLDPKGLHRIFRYAYAVPCYGLAYYKDDSKDIAAAVEVGSGEWVVMTHLLPKKGEFYLFPIRICPCFSEIDLNAVDFWNKPLEVACPDNAVIWINYTHREALKELGIEEDLVFRMIIKDEKGDTETIEVKIPNP